MEPDQPRGGGGQPPPPPGEAWTALSHLLSGFLLFGGIGWGLDKLLDMRVFTVVGLLAGGVASLYLIYLRYVKS
ncbi:AtpZ/AtpI family protein [Pseudonocardia hispaniensis]|uniref:AtpZ/AtpI family protein n=1 Tax=Pseudonocardia hispaniensis TaxID=904933 RepID=A0ABW1J7M0_9PSEU